MAQLIELTQLSPTMSEGNFVRWTINKGDSVDPGDVIAEVETDKAVMEMEALDSGILLATLAEEGCRSRVALANSPEFRSPSDMGHCWDPFGDPLGAVTAV